jgi:hypothetical protein
VNNFAIPTADTLTKLPFGLEDKTITAASHLPPDSQSYGSAPDHNGLYRIHF